MPLRRSTLFVPGTMDEAAQRQIISGCGADLVCLDLEDTVVPARKAEARKTIARLLTEDIWGRSDRAVRINSAATPYAKDDIAEVLAGARGRVNTILTSKGDTADEVRWIDEQISQAGRKGGFEHDHIKLCIGIESARALTDIDQIASASPRLECLGFAIGDLSISLGIPVAVFMKDRSLYPGDLFHFHRARIVLAAKANGLLTMDAPWPIINDHATLAEDARWGMMMGFDGKLALAVEQIKVIHQAYRPTPEQIAHAQWTMDQCRKSFAAGDGSVTIDGEFIDQVVIGFAEKTLSRAAAPL